jgi:osmoprotectant transport system permease protein
MIDYLVSNAGLILSLTFEHLFIVGLSLAIALVTGVPLGIMITRHQPLAQKVIGVANVIMTVPSIALFGLMLPVLAIFGHGLGKVPAVIALVLYSQLPIIRNTYTAILEVDPGIVDAARGMGLSKWQRLRVVEIPLAIPIILAGVRTAAVMNIGIAAIAAYVGAGGLGVLVQQGIARTYPEMILTGALVVSLLAVVVDLLLAWTERLLTPRGLTQNRGQ